MMGHRQVEQAALFYEFSLERHIPADHWLRSIDRFVDLQEIRQDLTPFYSCIGRPSIDPELMIRMLLIGYCYGIRSERRLCEEVDLNLAYRWFCRLNWTMPFPTTRPSPRTGMAAFARRTFCVGCLKRQCKPASTRDLSAVKALPRTRASFVPTQTGKTACRVVMTMIGPAAKVAKARAVRCGNISPPLIGMPNRQRKSRSLIRLRASRQRLASPPSLAGRQII